MRWRRRCRTPGASSSPAWITAPAATPAGPTRVASPRPSPSSPVRCGPSSPRTPGRSRPDPTTTTISSRRITMKSRLTAAAAAAAATAVAALAAVVSPGPIASAAAGPAAAPAPGWSAAWASAMQQPVPGNSLTGTNWSDGFTDQTIRQVIRVTGAGSRVRIRLSNLYGSGPLRVTGATIARTGTGAAVEPGTVRSLTFGRARSVTIQAGQVTISDPAALPVAPLESLTVTLFFAGPTGPATFHEDGQAVSYRANGDHRFHTDAA